MNPSDWLTIVGLIFSAFIGVISSVGYLVWWLSKQFTSVRHLVHDRVDHAETVLSGKLEYHERHDDARFSQISNDIWSIRIRNAARDGEIMEDRKALLKKEQRDAI